MRTILFIDEYFHDFKCYSELLDDNGFRVYPSSRKDQDEIKNQKELYEFLHNHKTEYNQLKENIFKYILEKELYKELTLLILDINLLGKTDDGNEDESGCLLLSDFRNKFYSYAQKHNIDIDENWSKNLTAIAFTDYPKEKRDKFMKRPGYFRDAISKKEVDNNPNAFIQKLNNWEMEKTQISKKTTSYLTFNINKTFGNGSPIVTGSNNSFSTNINNGNDQIINSYNTNEKELVAELGKNGITKEQADELIKILREEKQDKKNQILGPKAKAWCENIKTVAINVLSNLIFTIMYTLPKI
jgi:hypothetical protein